MLEIEYLSETVYWVRIPIGVIDGRTEDKIEDLRIEVTNPTDGGGLPYAVIEETDQKKVLAIMLEPPAKPGINSHIRMKLLWRGAYSPLIETHIDRGKITVDHFAKKIKARFIAPLGLEFTGIRMINNMGSYEITQQEDGRSILTWDCAELQKGNYSYSLICKKKEL